MRIAVLTVLALALVLSASAIAVAEPVAVRFTEGIGRGFPVLRNANGETIAHGDLLQVPRGDRIENRLTFRFRDGSFYDETVVFSQRDVFTLLSYRLVQLGPSFPESLEASVDRQSGRYTVRYRSDQDSPEELLEGRFEIPGDAYNGLLSTLTKNLPSGDSATVQIIAFTPKPRLVKMLLTLKLTCVSLNPNVARPGVPGGTSGGGRQAWIDAVANAFAGGAVTLSTKTGSSSVWPAACRIRTQKAVCAAVPVHTVAAAASGVG